MQYFKTCMIKYKFHLAMWEVWLTVGDLRDVHCSDEKIIIKARPLTLLYYGWPLGAKNVQDLTFEVRRLRWHLRRLRCHLTRLTCQLARLKCHLRRLTLDVKSKTFFAPNGHLYCIASNGGSPSD